MVEIAPPGPDQRAVDAPAVPPAANRPAATTSPPWAARPTTAGRWRTARFHGEAAGEAIVLRREDRAVDRGPEGGEDHGQAACRPNACRLNGVVSYGA